MKIRLLGTPEIRDAAGALRPVRGHQAWALLARVLLSDGSVGRQELAANLFPETVDPLGALRWCLASLRKAIGSSDILAGDPLEADLPPETSVDVLDLEAQDVDPENAGDLLDGIEPRCSPEFATWLLVERERIGGLIDAKIRQQTMRSLSVRDYGRALRLAELAVRRNTLDEGAHVLLVRSLMLAGRHKAALGHVEATREMFLQELGIEPSTALHSAARRSVSSPPAGVTAQSRARSLLESGLAAVAAGAADAGIDCLRRGVACAETSGDEQLHAGCLLELGTALVHAVRGYDDEGAIVLRQCVELAEACSDPALAAAGYGELGYIEALAGRRPSARSYLESGLKLANDPNTRAAIHSVLGFNLVDWGKAEQGLVHYEHALELARRAENRRREIWVLGIGARGHMSVDHLDAAQLWLTESLSLVEDLRWVAFRPWPLALLAEAELKHGGDPSKIRPRIEEAFALGCQIADPCWEALAGRVMAHADIACGDYLGASRWLAEAYGRCIRETDVYRALQVEILGDRAAVHNRLGQPDQADAVAREWLSLAARVHMDAHVERAALQINAFA